MVHGRVDERIDNERYERYRIGSRICRVSAVVEK